MDQLAPALIIKLIIGDHVVTFLLVFSGVAVHPVTLRRLKNFECGLVCPWIPPALRTPACDALVIMFLCHGGSMMLWSHFPVLMVWYHFSRLVTGRESRHATECVCVLSNGRQGQSVPS